MRTPYITLCRVQMRYNYFPSGFLTALTAAPTPATAARLRRAGLLFQAEPDGFTLLYTDASLYTPLARLQPVFPLLFGLTATDLHFTSYTNLPLELTGPDHTYCLRPAPNLPLGPIGPAEVLPLRPLVFSQPLSPGPAGTVQLVSHPPGPVPLGWPVPANATVVPIDLRPWGSGYYQMLLPNQRVPIAFYADDFLCHTRPWGLLEIGAAVLAAAAGHPPEPPAYTLTFEARATY